MSDGVEFIGDGAFASCENLRFAKLGEGARLVGRIFHNCNSLTEIVAPASSLVSVGEYAFCECNRLSKVYVYIDEEYGDENFSYMDGNDPLAEVNIYLYSATTPDFTAIPEGYAGYWYYDDAEPIIWEK